MKIELFGIARARAGCEQVAVEARTLGEALRALASEHPALVPEVIDGDRLSANFLASKNGEHFLSDPEAALDPGDTVLILGAQAGG